MKRIRYGLFVGVMMVSVFGVALHGNDTPVAGVSVTDTFSVTISERCTFTRTTGNGTYAVTMAMNALNTNAGTSTFTAICNNASGFSVSAVPSSITGDGAAITYSATTPTKGSGTWTAAKGDSSSTTNIAASNGVLMSANGPTTGLSQQVTYKVSTHSNQAKGSYTGTIKYTLVQSN